MSALTPAQRDRLAECEATIERGLATFVEVGQALRAVLDEGLYVERYGTFEAYTKDRWGLSYSRAKELMLGSRVARQINDATDGVPSVMITTANQASALAPVPEPERAEVWQQAVERTGGKPTGAVVREIRQERAVPSIDQVVDRLAETDPGVRDRIQATRIRADIAKLNHAMSVLGLLDVEQVAAAVEPLELRAFVSLAREAARWAEALEKITRPGPRLVGQP